MKNIFILLTLSIHPFTSFTQKRFYIPSAYQISDFDNKKQISLSIAKSSGYDANLSYSFSKHFYTLFAYGINNWYEERSTILSCYGIYNNNTSLSAQFGYYKKINKPWVDNVEVYLGYSKNKIDNYWDFIEYNRPDPATAQFTAGKYNSLFLGSNLITQNKVVEFSFGFRLSYYKYDTLSFYNNASFNYPPISTVRNYYGVTTELIQGLGLQHKSFKLLLQGGISIPITYPYAEQTDAQLLNNGIYITTHKEKLPNYGSLIFRLSIQYNLKMLQKQK